MNARKKKSVILLISIILIELLNIYTETFPFHFFHSQKDNIQSLRVLTYNIGQNNPKTRDKDGIQQFIELFKTIDADIVVLPESRLWLKKELVDALDSIYSYSIFPFFKGKEIYVETAIFSRFPLGNVQSINKNYIYSSDVILPNHQSIKLIACHLTSNQKNSQLNGGEGLLKNIRRGKEKRLQEIQDICDYLKDKEQGPIMVCGDMNDVSGSSVLRSIQSNLDLEDTWWNGGCGYGATFWGKHLLLRLDHILISPHFQTNNTFVINNKLSDHYPLVADYSIKE